MKSFTQTISFTINSVGEFFNYLGSKISQGALELTILIGAFFAPAAPILMAVGLAILLDTYFGRWKSRKIGEEVTSKKTRIGLVPKSIGYCLVVLTFYMLDYAIVDEFVHFFFPISFISTKLVALVLIYIEYTSMDESYEKVKGIKLKQAFANMMKSVRTITTDIYKTKDGVDKFKKDK